MKQVELDRIERERKEMEEELCRTREEQARVEAEWIEQQRTWELRREKEAAEEKARLLATEEQRLAEEAAAKE